MEAHVRQDAVAARRLPQVVEDLRLRGERARPVRVRGERERVEVRGHVAAAARVGVVPPGAADVAGALQQHEVVLALLLEPDGHAEPREAGAHDGDAKRSVLGHVNLRSPGRSSSTVQSASCSTGTSGWSHIQWATPSWAELTACAASSSSRGSTSAGASSLISSRIRAAWRLRTLTAASEKRPS